MQVRLARREAGSLLSVSDDGAGFAETAESAARSASMGLQLAASLAVQLGGSLSIGSAGGTVSTAPLTRL